MSWAAGEDQVERIMELTHSCVLNEQGRLKKPSGQVNSEILRNICCFVIGYRTCYNICRI